MSLQSHIKYCKNLTPAEMQFGEYLLSNTQSIGHISLNDLLESAFISRAMFYRFCKKLEISGFNELKLLLLQDNEQKKQLSIIDVNFPFSAQDSQRDIADKLIKLYTDTIQNTRHYLDKKELWDTVLCLHKAKSIDIYAALPNSIVADSFQYKMLSIGKDATSNSTHYMQISRAAISSSEQAAVILSYSGRTSFIKSILPLLCERHVPVVWIGRPGNSELINAIDHHIYISDQENFRERLSQFASQAAMQYIMDLLFSCLFKLDYEKNITFLQNHNRLCDNRPIT